MHKNGTLPIKQIGGALLIAAMLILSFFNRDTEGEAVEVEGATAVVISENTAVPTVAATAVSTTAIPTPPAPLWADADGEFDYYVLALSWQPAFCETESRKPECVSQTATDFDATHFVLHGLWPNRANDPSHSFAYCQQPDEIVDQDHGDWCAMPDLSLSETVMDDLHLYMPGSASCLQNHEWYKHGVCAGMSDDAYFALTNALTASFSQTAFNQWIADNIGQELSRRDVLNAFADEFGSDTYLSLRCTDIDSVSTLSEIRLVLKRELGDVSDYSTLFPTESVRPNGTCPARFMIDGVD